MFLFLLASLCISLSLLFPHWLFNEFSPDTLPLPYASSPLCVSLLHTHTHTSPNVCTHCPFHTRPPPCSAPSHRSPLLPQLSYFPLVVARCVRPSSVRTSRNSTAAPLLTSTPSLTWRRCAWRASQRRCSATPPGSDAGSRSIRAAPPRSRCRSKENQGVVGGGAHPVGGGGYLNLIILTCGTLDINKKLCSRQLQCKVPCRERCRCFLVLLVFLRGGGPAG